MLCISANPPLSLSSNGVLTVEQDTPLDVALDKMVKNNLSSLPVVTDVKGNFYGCLDIAQIVTFISRNFANYNFKSFEDFDQVFKSVRKFHDTSVGDLVKGLLFALLFFELGLWYKRSAEMLNYNYSLFNAFEYLARGYHRLVICDGARKIQTVVTQSMAIDYVRNNFDLIRDSIRLKKVSAFVGLSSTISICETERPLLAFTMMSDYNIRGLGVVNREGVLVDAISARDLRGLSMESDSIWRLYGDIKTFKAAIRSKFPNTPTEIVYVTEEDTLEKCVREISTHKVHRLFVVDQWKKPVKVITITDILYNIMFAKPVADVKA